MRNVKNIIEEIMVGILTLFIGIMYGAMFVRDKVPPLEMLVLTAFTVVGVICVHTFGIPLGDADDNRRLSRHSSSKRKTRVH